MCKHLRFAMALPFAIILSSCGYEGDGKFRTHGIWPIISYELELPEFDLKSNQSAKFNIRGYKSHGTSYLSLILESEKPVAYKDLTTNIELRISGRNNVTYFYRNSTLNAHYLRMRQAGEKLWANEYEWDGHYEYSAYILEPGSSTFHEPASTTKMVYVQSMPTGIQDYDVLVKIGHVPEPYNNIKARLELSSGWK